MVYFQTKNPNLGKFWRVLQWKMSVYFMDIWSILRTFWHISLPYGIFCGNLVYFPPFWYVVPRKLWQPCYPGVPRWLRCGLVSASQHKNSIWNKGQFISGGRKGDFSACHVLREIMAQLAGEGLVWLGFQFLVFPEKWIFSYFSGLH
jgi:hypothetical protein